MFLDFPQNDISADTVKGIGVVNLDYYLVYNLPVNFEEETAAANFSPIKSHFHINIQILMAHFRAQKESHVHAFFTSF